MGKVLGGLVLALAGVVAYAAAFALVVGGATFIVRTVWFW